jgi:hypothetical protein
MLQTNLHLELARERSATLVDDARRHRAAHAVLAPRGTSPSLRGRPGAAALAPRAGATIAGVGLAGGRAPAGC